MPELTSYAHDCFPRDLHWQAVSFMRMAWPWIEAGPLAETYPAAWRPTHFALTEGVILLSYAAIFLREVRHAGTLYRLAGLGNVLTYPSFRQRGYGGRVVHAATDALDASGANVAALFCVPALIPFYARHGWEPLPAAHTTSGPLQTSQADEVRMMRFLSSRGRVTKRSRRKRSISITSGRDTKSPAECSIVKRHAGMK